MRKILVSGVVAHVSLITSDRYAPTVGLRLVKSTYGVAREKKNEPSKTFTTA